MSAYESVSMQWILVPDQPLYTFPIREINRLSHLSELSTSIEYYCIFIFSFFFVHVHKGLKLINHLNCTCYMPWRNKNGLLTFRNEGTILTKPTRGTVSLKNQIFPVHPTGLTKQISAAHQLITCNDFTGATAVGCNFHFDSMTVMASYTTVIISGKWANWQLIDEINK